MMNNFRIVKRYGDGFPHNKGPRYLSAGRKQSNARQQSIEEYCYPRSNSQSATSGTARGNYGNEQAYSQIQTSFRREHRGRGVSSTRGKAQFSYSKPEENYMNIDEDLWNTEFSEDWSTQPNRQTRPPLREIDYNQQQKFAYRSQNPTYHNCEFQGPKNNLQRTTTHGPVRFCSDSIGNDQGKFPDFDDFYQERDHDSEGAVQQQQPSAKKKPSNKAINAKNSSVVPKYSSTANRSGGENYIQLKACDSDFPRIFTVSAAKLQSWNGKNPFNTGEIIFELFGILDSVNTNSEPGTQQFVIKGQQKGRVDCIFYEIDRSLKLDNIGQWHRCMGLLRSDKQFFQCLSLRPATKEELKVLDNILSANSKTMAVCFLSKTTA